MKTINFSKHKLIACILFYGLPHSVYAYNCDNWVAKLQSAQGSVQIRQSEKNTTTKSWITVKRNDTFCKGDVLRVQENSRAALLLRNETIVRLDQNTTITFTSLTPDKPSVVSLETGVAHFISRVKAAFEVITPFINAAIEGTEFVVSAKQNVGEVTVFEGSVRAYNQHGEVRLTTNQTAQAKQGQAPVLVIRVKPRDAVNWSLYYPAVFDPNDLTTTGRESLQLKASNALATGQVEQAANYLQQVLEQTPNNVQALAMQAIVSIAQNDKDKGLKLAQQAVAANDKSATAKLALSYAQQAHFNIGAALKTLQEASKTNNALVWSRLAEVYLMHGELDKALSAAKKANELNPKLGRTHTVLGFAYLTRIEIAQAIETFNKAIDIDQADPLARLGLGLATIRKGNLKEGRREIEYAATLDPNNALIRSYLGKAYYEEKRNDLAAVQFEMAKALDPNDPTAYFYNAIRLQSDNKPKEALTELQQAQKQNNNKAVYRSKQLLDQDAAVQSLSQARFYNKLGFKQQALSAAQSSLSNNPANHSAHRFLADAYASQPRAEVARVSEALVAQLLQPINAAPVQAKLSENNLSTINQTGINNLTYNEYTPLFLQNGAYLYTSGYVGSQHSQSADTTLAVVQNEFAFSLSGYRYLTDGFRTNADLEETLYSAFAQVAISPTLSIQAETKKWETNHGDIDMLFDPANFSTLDRRYINQNTQRLGIHQKPSTNSDIIISLLQSERRGNQQLLNQSPTVTEDIMTDGSQSEIQYLFTGEAFNLQLGFAKHDVNESTIQVIDWTSVFGSSCPGFLPASSCGSTRNFAIDHDLGYIYSILNLSDSLRLSLGGSYDQHKTRGFYISKFNPKVGFNWTVNTNTILNLAYFETVKRPLLIQQVIEPSQINGFTQFYDERNGSTANNLALSADVKNSKLSYGASALRRNVRIPQFESNAFTNTQPRRETRFHAYINWLASTNWSFSLAPEKETFNNQDTGPSRLYSTHVPLTAKYHSPNGVSTSYTLNYVRQEVTLSSGSYNQTREDFISADLHLNFKLDKRLGQIGISVTNLFEQNFNYQDLNFIRAEPVYPRYLPTRTVLFKASLNF